MKPNKSKAGRIGIWMDHTRAKIIHAGEPSKRTKVILAVPGSHSSKENAPNHNRNSINEYAQHNKEQNEVQSFYKQLSKETEPFNEILILGPTKAHQEFYNFIMKEEKSWSKKIASETSDYITDNQLNARVNNFFNAKTE